MAGGPRVRVTVLAVLLAACGSSERSGGGGGDDNGGSPSGGGSGTGGTTTAGTAGSGGATNGGSAGSSGGNAGTANGGAAGSSAGSGAVGSSEVEACMAYSGAFCRRAAVCEGATNTDPYPCAAYCPDSMFGPGSTRTVEGLFACAETLETWPCEDFLAGRDPPCTTPGTRQLGERCLFPSQCQTLTCKVDPTLGCGVCARRVPENADCTPADASCDAGLFCTQGVCRPYMPTTPKQPGEACASFSECEQSTSFCNEMGICELYGGSNASCITANKCLSPYYCATADHICKPRPQLGQACGDDAATLWACANGLRCTTSSSSGTCVEPTMVAVGADCTSPASVCPREATCSCIDPACAMRRCTVPKLVGETCNDDVDLCHNALECVNGICARHGYQNLYEDACEM